MRQIKVPTPPTTFQHGAITSVHQAIACQSTSNIREQQNLVLMCFIAVNRALGQRRAISIGPHKAMIDAVDYMALTEFFRTYIVYRFATTVRRASLRYPANRQRRGELRLNKYTRFSRSWGFGTHSSAPRKVIFTGLCNAVWPNPSSITRARPASTSALRKNPESTSRKHSGCHMDNKRSTLVLNITRGTPSIGVHLASDD